MLNKVYFFFKDFRKNLRLKAIKKIVSEKVTLVGENQAFGPYSSVSLVYGSSKNDIVIHEHVDMFGTIHSCAGGKVIMHEWSKIGPHSDINSVNRVEIGKNTAIASRVTIIDNNTHSINPEDRLYMRHTPHGSRERSNQYSSNAPIIIGENVWIGTGARIQKGITIGDNSIIAAHSVVTHDVPANSIAAGNPARIVKTDIDKTTERIFPLKD